VLFLCAFPCAQLIFPVFVSCFCLGMVTGSALGSSQMLILQQSIVSTMHQQKRVMDGSLPAAETIDSKFIVKQLEAQVIIPFFRLMCLRKQIMGT
jgi:hypothetical protein